MTIQPNKYGTKIIKQGSIIQFDYINHVGELARRSVMVESFSYGNTPYHGEHQWLLNAIDLDKKARRTFAMKDISYVDYFHD